MAGAGTSEPDVDNIIRKLLAVEGKPGKFVNLLESEINYLIETSKEILLSQPTLLQLRAPIKIVGDIHGQYHDLLRLLRLGGFPPDSNYLFLGDYVDRGRQSIETICLVLAYKIKYPENFFMLRGNHESQAICRIYGFYEECRRRYSVRVWKSFCGVFDCLPVAAVIEDKIFCVHGGLSPDLHSLDDIVNISRPTDVPEMGLLCDLLWSDPEEGQEGWAMSDRGVSVTYGEDIVTSFCEDYDVDLICRAHQVFENGYEFFADKQLVTVFSAPDYAGEYDNSGAMMSVNEDLLCSFQILKSSKYSSR